MIPDSTQYKLVDTKTGKILREGSKQMMHKPRMQINKEKPDSVFVGISTKKVGETFGGHPK